MPVPPQASRPVSAQVDRIWALLCGQESKSITGVALDEGAPRGWSGGARLEPQARQLLDLYAPLRLSGDRAVSVLGHLGQSVDGFVAGADGVSRDLSSHENIVHLHRLRALFGAVLVGRKTACMDNPKLTTRLVPGPSPVRVVLDPHLRCDPGLDLFNDGLADTVLVCGADAPQRRFPASTRMLRLKQSAVDLREVLAGLRALGLGRIFVEGGGETVSGYLRQGLLQRLHVAVAPVIIGNGRRGLQMPEYSSFAHALRPTCMTFPMGSDVLFDFELGPEAVGGPSLPPGA